MNNEIQLWNNEEKDMTDEEKLGCKILIGIDGGILKRNINHIFDIPSPPGGVS